MYVFLLQEQRSLKAGDLSHQESNNMAASTMKLHSDSFTSEKVSEHRLFSHQDLSWRTWRTTKLFSADRVSRRSDCRASLRGKTRNAIFSALHSCFWRSTKERALKRPRTDSLNRKLSSITTSKNRGRRFWHARSRRCSTLFLHPQCNER